jgi:hypothetical protein
MNVDPNNRFSDMRAMGRQLLLLAGQRTRITWGLTFGQEGRGPLPLATLERPSLPEHVPTPPPRKKRATAMLIAGVAVLSASLTSLFLTPDRDEPTSPQAQAPSTRSDSDPRTVVLPNTPTEEPKPQAPILAPPPVAEVPRAVNRQVSTDDDEREAASASANERPIESARPKPQRVARREPAKPAPRPAPPRRRPPPQPAAERANGEDVADWEINLASKVPSRNRQNFEVGSNNAPILD